MCINLMNWVNTGSDNGFAPVWHQAIITTHYSDIIMSTMASQITGIPIVCSTVCSGADQRKYQSSALLAFLRGILRWPLDSPHKGPVTRIMFSFDDVIMQSGHTVDWTHRDKFMWNLNQNTNTFCQENPLSNIVIKMAAIIFWPQCVN